MPWVCCAFSDVFYLRLFMSERDILARNLLVRTGVFVGLKNSNILQKSDKKKVKELLEILPDKSSKVGESRARPVVHH